MADVRAQGGRTKNRAPIHVADMMRMVDTTANTDEAVRVLERSMDKLQARDGAAVAQLETISMVMSGLTSSEDNQSAQDGQNKPAKEADGSQGGSGGAQDGQRPAEEADGSQGGGGNTQDQHLSSQQGGGDTNHEHLLAKKANNCRSRDHQAKMAEELPDLVDCNDDSDDDLDDLVIPQDVVEEVMELTEDEQWEKR